MSYYRVIPRDLFNEANLLKCYGQLTLFAEKNIGLKVEQTDDGQAFDVQQDNDDGSLYVANIFIEFNGRELDLRRSLNSREAWPLYVFRIDGAMVDPLPVFDASGNLSREFLSIR